LVFRSAVSENDLDLNWQRLILTHLMEKTHLGVLTGSPITDMVITLIAGRAHLKHTEGGDFRQATYRAVRQGLRQAESILLEPWYEVELELPGEHLGRAMSDLQQRYGTFDPPEQVGDRAVLRGTAPVSELEDYAAEVHAYTKGRGRLSLRLKGYFPCHDREKVIAQLGYDPDSDPENTADSVFCSHGAGVVVPWHEVAQHQHLDSPVSLEAKQEEAPQTVRQRPASYADAVAQDKQLQAIFEQTYGPVKRKRAFESPVKEHKLADHVTIRDLEPVEEYLLVDGYNIIFSWQELSRLSKNSMERARQALMDDLCQYQAQKKCHVILVFDAYRVKGGVRRMEQYHNIHVVYTQEAETADSYIEQASYKLSKRNRVRVATSDGMEQVIVMGHGCLRVSAKAFEQEMELVKAEIRRLIEQNHQH
jgi:predicted RNA-binding protein with PIN domain